MAKRIKFPGGDPIGAGAGAIPSVPVFDGDVRNTNLFAKTMHDMSSRMQDKMDRQTAKAAAIKGEAAGLKPGFEARADDTIAAEAYNQAGMTSYLAKLEIDTRNKLDEYRQQYQADPEGMQKAIAGYRAGVLGELKQVAPEMVGDYVSMIERNSRGDIRAAAQAHQALVMSQAGADLAEATTRQLVDVRRLSESIGDDSDYAVAMVRERNLLRGRLMAHGPSAAYEADGAIIDADPGRTGLYTPEQIQKALVDFEKEARSARVIGKFKMALDSGQALSFIQAFGDDENIIQDPVEREDLYTTMISQMNRRQSVKEERQRRINTMQTAVWREGKRQLTDEFLTGTLDSNEITRRSKQGIIDPADAEKYIERAMQRGPAFDDQGVVTSFEFDLLEYGEEDIVGSRHITHQTKRRLIKEHRDLSEKTKNWRGTVEGKEAIALIKGELGIIPGAITLKYNPDVARKASRAMHDLYKHMEGFALEEILLSPRMPLDFAENLIIPLQIDSIKKEIEPQKRRIRVLQLELKGFPEGSSRARNHQNGIDALQSGVDEKEDQINELKSKSKLKSKPSGATRQ